MLMTGPQPSRGPMRPASSAAVSVASALSSAPSPVKPRYFSGLMVMVKRALPMASSHALGAGRAFEAGRFAGSAGA